MADQTRHKIWLTPCDVYTEDHGWACDCYVDRPLNVVQDTGPLRDRAGKIECRDSFCQMYPAVATLSQNG